MANSKRNAAVCFCQCSIILQKFESDMIIFNIPFRIFVPTCLFSVSLQRSQTSLDTLDFIIKSKTRYDAFYKTELNSLLISLGIETLIISGVRTNLCCETTARSEYNVSLTLYIELFMHSEKRNLSDHIIMLQIFQEDLTRIMILYSLKTRLLQKIKKCTRQARVFPCKY